MDEIGAAYHGVRMRVGALLEEAGDPVFATRAPATPDWTVHDVLAHLVGVTADIVSGNLDGVGTDPWAAAQVEARRDRTGAELLAEWGEHGPVVEGMAGQFGRAAGQLVSDAATHEHDIRGALDLPGARDSDAVVVSVGFVGRSLSEQLDAAARGALVVHHDGRRDTFGSREPVATLRIDDFELLRALTGRRSVAQMEAYDWDGEFAPEHLVLARFTPRLDPLAE